MAVYSHPTCEHDPDWAILGDFVTASHEIPNDNVRDWLDAAVLALNEGDWIYINGGASHAGRRRGYDNLGLSSRRANEVKLYFERRAAGNLDHITLVEFSGDTRAGGNIDDNEGRWRSVEVIITPHRIPPERTEPDPTPVGPRFRVRVASGDYFLELTSVRLVFRDTRRHTEMEFDLNGIEAGLLPPPKRVRGGRWSDIPNDRYVRRLHDFQHARVTAGSIGVGPHSASFLRIRTEDRRARALVVNDLDTGDSFVDASLSALQLNIRSAERPY